MLKYLLIIILNKTADANSNIPTSRKRCIVKQVNEVSSVTETEKPCIVIIPTNKG